MWKDKNQKIKDDFKELLTEFKALQEKYDEERKISEAQIAELEKNLESLTSDKNELAESLDLTKV